MHGTGQVVDSFVIVGDFQGCYLLKANTKTFFQQNAFENIVCNMSAILFKSK